MKDGAVDGAPMNLDYLVYNNGQQADSNDDNSDTMKVVEDTDAEGYWILKLDYSDVNEVQFTRYQK